MEPTAPPHRGGDRRPPGQSREKIVRARFACRHQLRAAARAQFARPGSGRPPVAARWANQLDKPSRWSFRRRQSRVLQVEPPRPRTARVNWSPAVSLRLRYTHRLTLVECLFVQQDYGVSLANTFRYFCVRPVIKSNLNRNLFRLPFRYGKY